MIKLFYNDGFEYKHKDNTYIKGYFYKGFDNLSAENVFNELSDIKDEKAFSSFLKSIDGCFQIIFETKDKIFAAVDFIRSMPLFYTTVNSEFYISDNSDYLSKLSDDNGILSPLSLSEFKLTGYVIGNNTLYKNIFSLNNGEFLCYDKISKSLTLHEYRAFIPIPQKDMDFENSLSKLNESYENMTKQLISSINDRQIVVPLSGGEDSRIVVNYLHKLNVKNVICYTYGIKSSTEAQISKKVAEFFGYEWHFVEYNHGIWKKFFEGEDYKNFAPYISRNVSTPHIQDFIAFKTLIKENIIPEKSIIIPGHTGDFQQGIQTPGIFVPDINIKKNVLLNEILGKHYINYRWNSDDMSLYKEITDHIFKDLKINKKNYSSDEAYSLFDYFNWKERHSKHIANSIRIYEYFNCEWRMPLWSSYPVNFWSKLPKHFRYNRKFHYNFVCIYEKELRKYLGLSNSNPPNCNYKYKVSKKDFMRLKLPAIFRKLKFNKINKSLSNQYEEHEFGWFKIISKDTFEKNKKNYGSVNSIVTMDYLNRFIKKRT